MSKLQRLIQVAKRELAMDDDSYRAMLESVAKKRSTKGMSNAELSMVVERMKALGFQPKRKKQPRVDETLKIKAIWNVMYNQGFVYNNSDQTVDAYVSRMTSIINGKGVERAIWLDANLAYKVLECLKNWHLRLMKQAIVKAGLKVPLNDQGTKDAGYDAVADYYVSQFMPNKPLK